MTTIAEPSALELTAAECVRTMPVMWAGVERVAPWFDPALLAPVETCTPVTYDVDEMRRTLGDTGLRQPVLQAPKTIMQLWRPNNIGYRNFGTASQRCVEADVMLDAEALMFATASAAPRFAHHPRSTAGSSAQVVHSRTTWVHAVHAQGLTLAMALSAGNPFPTRSGHLRPDVSIACVIERSFVFAAQAIRAGVDPLIARTWAGAIVVSHGLPRTLFALGVNERIDRNDYLFPGRTLVSDFYLRALEDVRDGDATRFMVLAARSAAHLRWS